MGGSRIHSSCQLKSRRWKIKYESGFEDTTEGEAVIGQYPELGGSNPNFSYCSVCTGRQGENRGVGISDPAIWMEGEFYMIPGTIAHPNGEKFAVRVARFYFAQPSVLERLPGAKMDVLDWN